LSGEIKINKNSDTKTCLPKWTPELGLPEISGGKWSSLRAKLLRVMGVSSSGLKNVELAQIVADFVGDMPPKHKKYIKPFVMFYADDIFLKTENKCWMGVNNTTPLVPKKNGFGNEVAKRHYRIESDKFLKSKEWRTLRYEVLRELEGLCQLCGRGRKQGVILHVDHIKPRSTHPELRLVKENLQVLCEDCNVGKSNLYEDDWRGLTHVD